MLATFSAARGALGETLSAIEFLDGESYELVTRHGARPPLATRCAQYVLVEVSGSHAAHCVGSISWLALRSYKSCNFSLGIF